MSPFDHLQCSKFDELKLSAQVTTFESQVSETPHTGRLIIFVCKWLSTSIWIYMWRRFVCYNLALTPIHSKINQHTSFAFISRFINTLYHKYIIAVFFKSERYIIINFPSKLIADLDKHSLWYLIINCTLQLHKVKYNYWFCIMAESQPDREEQQKKAIGIQLNTFLKCTCELF